MKAASTFSPPIQSCGNGSISSACSHIRVSSSPARSSSKLRRASSASRGSYAAPARRSMTRRASSGPAAERKREMSRATCKRRIGNGIASPRVSGNPRPSQRAKTYSSAAWMLEAEVEPPREPLRDLAHRRERSARPRAGVGDRVLDQRGAHLRWAARPDMSPVEGKDLCRVGRVDEVERGSVRDVVAVEQRRLVPVRRAPRSVEERDVVRVGELARRRSGELAEADGEHGGAQRVLERLPGAEIGRERECTDHLGDTDRPLGRGHNCCLRFGVLRRHVKDPNPLPSLRRTVQSGSHGLRAPAERADDEARTRDPQLGKLMLYQLSYVRVAVS